MEGAKPIAVLPRLVCLLLLTAAAAFGGSVEDYAAKVAPLIDPAKLATLGARNANPRVQKTVYWLAVAKQDRTMVAESALRSVGMTNALALELTKAALLRNVSIAEKLGRLDKAGLAEMRWVVHDQLIYQMEPLL